MKSLCKILLLLIYCLMLVVPHLAEARAGGGGSVGSRGSHTYSAPPSYNAAPITRSITPPPSSAPSSMGAPSYNPGFAPSGMGHPFLSGLAGGFLGAGLMGMLFGHGYGYGMGMSPMGSALGGLFQMLVIAAIVYFAFRWWRQRQGGGFPTFGNSFDAPFISNMSPSLGLAATAQQSPLAITAADTDAFQQLLVNIQNAWGAADLNHLRQYLTPEMAQYFSETLSANSSRGEVNRISGVTAPDVTLLESWSEYDLDYATARMTWQAVDFMARIDRQPSDADYVASGDAAHATQAQEIWTFVRARSGGHWLLSAIQQIA